MTMVLGFLLTISLFTNLYFILWINQLGEQIAAQESYIRELLNNERAK